MGENVLDNQEAWNVLRNAPLAPKALKKIPKSVYGVDNLTSVEEWHLWDRLEESGLPWALDVKAQYAGSELRKTERKNYKTGQQEIVDVRWYLAVADGFLVIDGRKFPACGASENRRLDGAMKGAVTSAFGAGCKLAGITMSLYREEKTRDSSYPAYDYGPYDSGPPDDYGPPPVAPTQSRVAMTTTTPAPQQATSLKESLPDQKEIPDPASQAEKVSALTWYSGQIPDGDPDKDKWVRQRIITEVGLFEKNKRDGKLTDTQRQIGDGYRYVFGRIKQIHERPQNCGKECTHWQPVATVFRAGGAIVAS